MRLAHGLFRGSFIGFRCGDGGGAGFRSRHGLIVDLVGNLLLLDEKLVTLDVVLKLDVARFRLLDLRVRGNQLFLRRKDTRFGVLYVGRTRGDLAFGTDRSDWNCDVERLGGGFLVGERGLGLSDRDFVVPGINFDEDRAFFDVLVVIDIHFDDVA